MDRAFSSGSSASPPAAPASPSIGYATGGNPGTATPATKPGPYWYHMMTEELRGVIVAAGLIPVQGDVTQLRQALQAFMQGQAMTYAADTGVANAAVVSYLPAIVAVTDGMVLWFKAKFANAGAMTLNVNGLGVQPVVGGAHSALQGGEIIANGRCMVIWNATLASWVLIECTGGALQIAQATQSGHAAPLSQLLCGVGSSIQNVTASRAINVTYTNSTGRPILVNLNLGTTAVNQSCSLTINGLSFTGASQPTAGLSAAGTFIVPAGATYLLPSGSYTLASWLEIR